MKALTFACVLALLTLAAARAGSQSAAGYQTSNEELRAIRLRERDAWREGGIRAAAAVTGHVKATVSADPENNVGTLDQLVAWHSLIVIGRIGRDKGWVTADGNELVTDFRVSIERVFKGPPLTEITVSILGGHVAFEDGSMATLTSTMVSPMEGQRYIFFLVPSDYEVTDVQVGATSSGGAWMLQHLSLGVFFLDRESGVMPRARPGHPLQVEFTGRAESEFIAMIRSRTGR